MASDALGVAVRGVAVCAGDACTVRRMITVVAPGPSWAVEVGAGGVTVAMDAPNPSIEAVATPAASTRLA